MLPTITSLSVQFKSLSEGSTNTNSFSTSHQDMYMRPYLYPLLEKMKIEKKWIYILIVTVEKCVNMNALHFQDEQLLYNKVGHDFFEIVCDIFGSMSCPNYPSLIRFCVTESVTCVRQVLQIRNLHRCRRGMGYDLSRYKVTRRRSEWERPNSLQKQWNHECLFE